MGGATIAPEEQSRLISFLEDAGGVYLEGNDFGLHHHLCALYGYFGSAYLGDGNNYYNVARLAGQPGSLAEGMVFHTLYGQEPDIFPDEIGNAAGTLLFRSQDGTGRGVQSHPLGTRYRTVHVTYPFGALIDGESMRSDLMERYVDFLWSEVHVGADPDETVIPQGGTLGYEWTLVNTTGTVQSIWARSRVRLPGGTVVPHLGPIPVTLQPWQEVSGHRSQPVPAGAPTGEYRYMIEVGLPPNILIDEGSFTFTVVPPGQVPSLPGEEKISRVPGDEGRW